MQVEYTSPMDPIGTSWIRCQWIISPRIDTKENIKTALKQQARRYTKYLKWQAIRTKVYNICTCVYICMYSGIHIYIYVLCIYENIYIYTVYV